MEMCMSAVGVAVGSDLVVWRVRAQATRLEEPNHGLGWREEKGWKYTECKAVLSARIGRWETI